MSKTAIEVRAHRASVALLDRNVLSQRPASAEHADEPPLPRQPTRLDLVPEGAQIRVRTGSRGECSEEWSRPTMDPRLRRRVHRDLAPRIGLLDERLDGRALLDGSLGTRRASGDGGIDDRLEQPSLAAERAVDRLDDDARLGGDDRHRHARIATLAEQRARRSHDVAPRLGSLLGAPGRSIRAPGLDSLAHFMRMILAPI